MNTLKHIDWVTVGLWVFVVLFLWAAPTLFYKEVYYLVGLL